MAQTNVDFTEARGSEWQWHQLGHMQVCTSLQTDNHASTPPLSFETVSGSGTSWAICKSAPCFRQTTTPAPHHSVFTGQMPFLPPNQQRQSTEGKWNVWNAKQPKLAVRTLHWRWHRVPLVTAPCSDAQSRSHKTEQSSHSYLSLQYWHLSVTAPNTHTGNGSALKIIINDTINLFFLNCSQHFGNFKPRQFTSAVW